MTSAHLKIGDTEFDLPVTKATSGPNGVIVASMRDDRFVSLDPGFLNTAQCESKITYIDGKKSILRYRGYPIEQLCEESNFLEVAWLLIYGELPEREQYYSFRSKILRHTMLGEEFRTFIASFPRSAHPMSVLASAVNALAAYYPDTTDINDREQLDASASIIMAKVRTIVSLIHRRRRDEPLLYTDTSYGYVDDFIRMSFAVPYQRYESDALKVSALDKLLTIHADHEQNCSTTIVRIAGSAHANMYSAVAAGINALSGPLHGGANEAVLRQLTVIRDSGISVCEYVRKAKEEGKRIAGLGHRVYKSYDPRAAIAKKYLDKLCADDRLFLSAEDRELFRVASELEEFARSHDVVIFVSGRSSSNGKVLFNECLNVNPRSYMIEDKEDIDFSILEGAESVGICGATSTPKWLMEKCRQCILENLKDN